MEEIKLPKWIRFKNNDNETEFFHLTKVEDVTYVNGLCQDNGKVLICNDKPIIKEVDTPQELIQSGDIIYYKYGNNKVGKMFIDEVDDQEICYMGSYHVYKDINDIEIIKILTPNSDDGFTKQWEAESKDET